MSNIEIQRDHNGELHMIVAGHPALGAKVNSITHVGNELGALIFVPMQHLRLGEVTNVVPLIRPKET